MNHENLPSIILDIAEAIAVAGGRAILVGGFVRDQVLYELERAVPDASGGPDDIDIEVYGLSLEELEGVLETFGEVISVGRSFGVFKVKRLFPDNSQDCSFSLPRRDNKVGSGHRGFQVELDPELGFEEASRRRDLTMNSIGWEIPGGQVEDPHGGRADIESGIMRATDPGHFSEDPLRGLRVAQFAARFPSMQPDDELLEMARKKSLRKRSVIEAQVTRMLADGKSRAFINTFAAHWLGTRTMRLVTPDVGTFPEFDEKLRDAMCRETELFFQEVMSKELSILLFIDSDFTFLNQRLAEHYGIPGVQGEKLRRVALKARRRGGVLTQGTVLTITSDPTRTSPVKRGKWILEQILGSPPPPPPPGDDNFVGESSKEELTLRARMELHREKPECAVCHDKMDTIGLGFERFDGIGSFRKTHAGEPILVSGTFPSGQTFENVGELKALLLRHKADFCRCLTEKMLIFALGRGLEYTDTSLVDEISSQLALNDYRFSTLVKQIVLSEQFRKRRGEQKPLATVK